RQAVQMKATGRCKRVVVAGCLVQRHKTDLIAEVPQIDRLVGVFDREHIVRAVRGDANPTQEHGHFLGRYHDVRARLTMFEDDRARLRLTPRHYAYLRISEGCNQGCTFCTIPSIRGPMRSKPVMQILAEARELAADGAVELNLIGQDTTSYGTDIGYAPGLSGLLRTLDRELADVRWLRLMYAYPSCFTDEMIRTIADCPRMVKYIDIPLQHISDTVLSRMKRRVTRREIETLLGKLRDWIPGISIRTTFIAGAPGETEDQHRELVRFVREFGFDMMGVFAYSQEPGTPMGRMSDQVSDDVKQYRVEELMLTQQSVAFAKARAMVGRTLEVLVDRRDTKDDCWAARHAGQAPEIDTLTYVSGGRLHAGAIASVRVTGARQYDLLATTSRRTARSLPMLAS
ncbi:MAG: MiaB/RimO family radical SAM methylthiotransferase, partial [Tepidisphaeraceae bacterium]